MLVKMLMRTAAKMLSSCQNADTDAIPFTIPFDERQRQAITHTMNTKFCDLVFFSFLTNLLQRCYHIFWQSAARSPVSFDTIFQAFPCASHLCALVT